MGLRGREVDREGKSYGVLSYSERMIEKETRVERRSEVEMEGKKWRSLHFLLSTECLSGFLSGLASGRCVPSLRKRHYSSHYSE